MNWGSFWIGVAAIPALMLAVALALGVIYLTACAAIWFIYRWRIRNVDDPWDRAAWAAKFAVRPWFMVSPHPRLAIVCMRKGDRKQVTEGELAREIESLMRRNNGAKASYL